MKKSEYKVLIVDDDASIRLLVKKMIGNNKFLIYESDSLEDALERAKAVLPHVIMLDINLGTESGFRFLEERRMDENLKNCQVIMMSSDTFEKNVKQAIALGADDFIAKPLVNTCVIRKIKRAILNNRGSSTSFDDGQFRVECVVSAIPVVKSENTYAMDSEVRLAENEVIKMNMDGHAVYYQLIGKSVKSKNGQVRFVVSMIGDVAKFVGGPINLVQVYDEEDKLEKLKATIYLLDDDENFSEILKVFFNKYDINIQAFNNTNDFLYAVGKKQPDLCLIDLSINYLNDSFVLIDRMSEEFPDLPIIAVTSSTDGVSTAHAIELGAVDFIYKPVKRNVLLHKVVRSLSDANVPAMYYQEITKNKFDHCYFSFIVSILSIDEIGITFSSRSFIQKGAFIQLESPVFEKIAGNKCVKLHVTKIAHNKDLGCFHVHGEFVDLSVQYIAGLINLTDESIEI